MNRSGDAMNRTAGLAIGIALAGCGNTSLDAGSDHPRGPLPVDARNPIVLSNDGARDNWQGEYAMALASAGELVLAGIVVDASSNYPSLDDNLGAWRAMVQAGRDSGMRNLPDPIGSAGAPLIRPADGNIDSTPPNGSEGARFILEAASRLSRPGHPLVIATGGRLTDLADAYLLDPSVANQIVVVASLGHPTVDGEGALMDDPNGSFDRWADEIVANRLVYVQVNAYYAQREDVPAARALELPANGFGSWMTSKIGEIQELHEAADQNSIVAAAIPSFALDVKRVSGTNVTSSAADAWPTLEPAANGRSWLVTRGDNAGATARFWRALKDPATFGR